MQTLYKSIGGMLLMMVLPIQVTLIPGYMTLRQLNLLNTYYAMALPMVFVPLGTFLLSRSFRAVRMRGE